MNGNLIGIILIGLFTLMGFLRGILRIALAFIALLISAILAKPFSFLLSWLVNKWEFVPLALKPLATLIATALLLFSIFLVAGSILISRREKRREEEGLSPIATWERIGGAVLGGFWGLFLTVLILTGIEMIGNIEETFSRFSSPAQEAQKTDQFFKEDWFKLNRDERVKKSSFPLLKEKVQDSIFAPLVQRVNPVDEKITEIIEKLLDVISDPEALERLKNHPEISPLMENPKFIEVAEDEDIQKALSASDFFSLLNNPKIAELMKDEELIRDVKKIDIERILDEILEERK